MDNLDYSSNDDETTTQPITPQIEDESEFIFLSERETIDDLNEEQKKSKREKERKKIETERERIEKERQFNEEVNVLATQLEENVENYQNLENSSSSHSEPSLSPSSSNFTQSSKTSSSYSIFSTFSSAIGSISSLSSLPSRSLDGLYSFFLDNSPYQVLFPSCADFYPLIKEGTCTQIIGGRAYFGRYFVLPHHFIFYSCSRWGVPFPTPVSIPSTDPSAPQQSTNEKKQTNPSSPTSPPSTTSSLSTMVKNNTPLIPSIPVVPHYSFFTYDQLFSLQTGSLVSSSPSKVPIGGAASSLSDILNPTDPSSPQPSTSSSTKSYINNNLSSKFKRDKNAPKNQTITFFCQNDLNFCLTHFQQEKERDELYQSIMFHWKHIISLFMKFNRTTTIKYITSSESKSINEKKDKSKNNDETIESTKNIKGVRRRMYTHKGKERRHVIERFIDNYESIDDFSLSYSSSITNRLWRQRQTDLWKQNSLPTDQFIINEYNCSLWQQELFLRGKFSITSNFLVFYTNDAGNEISIVIPQRDIETVEIPDSYPNISPTYLKSCFLLKTKFHEYMFWSSEEIVPLTESIVIFYTSYIPPTTQTGTPRYNYETGRTSTNVGDISQYLDDRKHFNSEYLSRELKQIQLYNSYFKNGKGIDCIRNHPVFLTLLPNGIPNCFRGYVWQIYSGSVHYLYLYEREYEEILEYYKDTKSEAIEQIERDINRTFPHHSVEGIESMRRVLTAYSWRNQYVGYCQSMNFVCSILLYFMSEVESYWLLSVLVENYLANYYSPDMFGCSTDQAVFSYLVSIHCPEVYKHLFDLSLPLSLLSMPWFVCLFINYLPLEVNLRILDSFFYEGPDGATLFQIGIALLTLLKETILEIDEASRVLHLFKNLDVDSDKLLFTAFTTFGDDAFKKTVGELRLRFRTSAIHEKNLRHSLTLSLNSSNDQTTTNTETELGESNSEQTSNQPYSNEMVKPDFDLMELEKRMQTPIDVPIVGVKSINMSSLPDSFTPPSYSPVTQKRATPSTNSAPTTNSVTGRFTSAIGSAKSYFNPYSYFKAS